ncbi:MAG: ATP-binding protein [Hyphomicrobiaceae bacterium]|nr:ATP-binding protein [Hyphomicrobiaceae bacterium]
MNEDDLVTILNALTEPVFLVNSDRHITLANVAAEELFGGGLSGRNLVHAIRHPDVLDSVEEVLHGKARSEAVISMPGTVRTTYKVSVVRLEDNENVEGTAILGLHDISHVLEAEQMRSDFVANVSHELRSPLSALSGGIETLQGAARNDPEAQTRFLGIMEREAARMNRLIDDLLSLSSVEVNERVRPSQRIGLLTIVERAIAALETQAKAAKKPIRLEISDPECVVLGDEDELTQVFHNLIDNALKYSRENGEVTVSVEIRENVAGLAGPAVVIAVSDQGEGIAAEHIPRLTERFYRVDTSRSREKGGTGLGLAIVKHILNRHRGRLLIDSEKGVGSTFTVCLPLEAQDQKR